MKYIKMLGLLAVAAAALMAFAGTASATTLTSPAGTTYTGELKATAGTTELHGEAFSINCKTSQFSGSVSQHGSGVAVKGSISTFDFNECSFPYTITVTGTFIILCCPAELYLTSLTITIHGPFGINCLYQTNNTKVGSLTGGTTAKLDINSSLIPRTGDSAFCGAAGEWTGSYTFNTPDTLLFDS